MKVQGKNLVIKNEVEKKISCHDGEQKGKEGVGAGWEG